MKMVDQRANVKRDIQILLRWRWLVLAIAVPISLVIELVEGYSIDLHLLDEIILDGLFLPFTTWIVLTLAARKIDKQFKREEQFELRQRLMQHLAEHRDYDDLAHFIVRFPATLLPVEHASLFLYDSHHAQLNFIKDWNSTGSGDAPKPPSLAPQPICSACASGNTSRQDHSGACVFAPEHPIGSSVREHCLPLCREKQLVAVLRLRYRAGEMPATEMIEFMITLLPELGQALSLAIEDAEEAEELYREAQIRERRRITHEMHDTLAQQVFYLHLGLDQLTDDTMLLANDAARRKTESMRDVAAEVYEQVRNNLLILRVWDQADLTEAICRLARITTHNADLEIAIDVQGRTNWLTPHTCEDVYGVVREGLNNIVKHARARQVELNIVWSTENLSVELVDDGVGFDPTHHLNEQHYGLVLMREVIESLQGVFTLDSLPGSGTRLQVTIPLQLPDSHLRKRKSWSHELHLAAEQTS